MRLSEIKKKMMKKKIRKIYIYPIVIILTLIYILPVLWLFSSSLKSVETYTRDQFTFRAFLPTEFKIENYLFVIRKGGLGRAAFNTFLVAILNIVACGFVNSLAGFSFAYLRFPGKNFLFTLVLALIIIPWDVLLLRNFITIKNLGLLNTYAALVLPGLANPYFIFLFRQFFLNIPRDIFDSARVDGCGFFQIYFKIIFPLARPVFTANAIVIFSGIWNAFLWPLIVITDPKYQLIQIALQRFLGSRTMDIGYVMASLSISAIPPLIVFGFFQKYFMAGLRGIGK